jgi:predicted porin
MNKKFLAVAIAGAMTAPMAAQAVKYSLSGQVNRAIVFQDDGQDSDIRNVDGTSSGTRFRLRGSEDLGNGLTVGFYWEFQTSSNPSGSQNPQLNGDVTTNLTTGGNLRQANVFFSSGWGKLTVGQTDGAGNGATEADLSGTGLVVGSYKNSYTGGMAWRTSNGGTIAGGLTNGQTYSNLDSWSRYDAIRYDSPALGPVTLSASIGNGNLWEVAGRLNTALMGGELSAALFYSQNHGQTATDDNRYGGSLSYLFSQGTSITGHYSANDQDVTGGTDYNSWSVKLGHKWGMNAVSIGYGQGSDFFANDYDSDMFDVAFVHTLKKANTDLYALFAYQTLDTPTGVASVEDQAAFVVGARLKFD